MPEAKDKNTERHLVFVGIDYPKDPYSDGSRDFYFGDIGWAEPVDKKSKETTGLSKFHIFKEKKGKEHLRENKGSAPLHCLVIAEDDRSVVHEKSMNRLYGSLVKSLFQLKVYQEIFVRGKIPTTEEIEAMRKDAKECAEEEFGSGK